MSILHQNMSNIDIFWFKLPGRSGSKFGQKFNFSKVLLSLKFNHNSFIIDIYLPIFWGSLNQNMSIFEMFWCNMDMFQVCTYWQMDKILSNLATLKSSSVRNFLWPLICCEKTNVIRNGIFFVQIFFVDLCVWF